MEWAALACWFLCAGEPVQKHICCFLLTREFSSPGSAADDYEVIRTLWGVQYLLARCSTPPCLGHLPEKPPWFVHQPAGVRKGRLGVRRRWLGHMWKVQLPKHTGFLAATGIQGTHKKAAKFTHVWIAEVKQSNIPSLKVQFFKYQNYGLVLAFIWGNQGHPVASAIYHR